MSNHTNTTIHGEHHEEHVSTQPRIVLTVMITLLVAAFFKHHQSRLFFPFTVLMFLFGMSIGGLAHGIPEMKYYLEIENIDPHLIFHVFLPVLIFDGASELKLNVFAKVFGQALGLAGPGLIVNTTLVAITMRYILYDFSWPAAFLFGAIMSATDPVAVVAILKELDADTAVSTLTDGEALMNDGTAIIMFTIFVPAAEVGGSFAPWYEYIWRALLFTVGAYVFGKICGALVVFCMTRTHNEPIVETLVLLGGSYLTFWIADVPMQSSGVLALATMGIHVSSNRNLVTKGLSEMVENFWELIVFIANAVIFALVGLIITSESIPQAEGADYGNLIALYILIHVFRALMIGMFMPMFNRGHYKINLRRYVMLVYGALRGGVSLTLALIVAANTAMPAEVREKTLFLVGGTVILSIAVNGSTSKFIVQALGLDLKPPYRNYQYRHGQKMIESAIDDKIRELRSQENSDYVNWPMLRANTLKRLSAHVDDTPESRQATQDDLFQPAMIRSMKHALMKRREEAKISAASFEELASLVNERIDQGQLVTMDDIEELLDRFPNTGESKSDCVDWWMRTYAMLFGSYTSNAVMHVEILSAFIETLEAVKPTVMLLLSRKNSIKKYNEWIDGQLDRAKRVMNRYHQRYSSITSGLHTMHAAQSVLHSAMSTITQLEEGRGFPRSQAEHMRLEVSNLMHRIANSDLALMPESAYEDVFRSCIMFEKDRKGIIADTLLDFVELLHAEPREPVKFETDCIGIVAKGRLVKLNRGDNLIYGPGDYFGLLNAMGSSDAGTYYTLENVVYYRINGEKFRAMLKNKTRDGSDCTGKVEDDAAFADAVALFEKHLWGLCGARLAQTQFRRQFPYAHYSMADLLRLANAGAIQQAPTGKQTDALKNALTNASGTQPTGVQGPGDELSPLMKPASVTRRRSHLHTRSGSSLLVSPLRNPKPHTIDESGTMVPLPAKAAEDSYWSMYEEVSVAVPEAGVDATTAAQREPIACDSAANGDVEMQPSLRRVDSSEAIIEELNQQVSKREVTNGSIGGESEDAVMVWCSETYTEPNSSWFLLSGSDVSGSISSSFMPVLPIGQTIYWSPGAIIFRLRDFPLSKREFPMTGIGHLDALNTKFEIMLNSAEKAISTCEKRVAPLITPQTVTYCQIFPFIEKVLKEFDLWDKHHLEIKSASFAFTGHVKQWILGSHVAPPEDCDMVNVLMRWFDNFIATPHPWAKAVVDHPDFVPHKYQGTIQQVIGKDVLHTWWREQGFLFDVEQYDYCKLDTSELRAARSFSD